VKHRCSKPVARLAVLPLGIAAALVPFASLAQSQPDVRSLDRIEVTGSRIKRADIEGAVPVTVIDRAAIDASGHVSVADVLRDTTFASFGNFSPRSGSSAQGVSDVNLRGIGSDRTLVLVDGRRAPYAPSLGSNADLNTIPMAAVERIEVLSDGASALYGSDAIGGVVNIILRKDFDGAELRLGRGSPDVAGGDTEEGSLLLGTSGERGNLMFGASYNARGIVFTRDQLGGDTRGSSLYGNNFYFESATSPGEEGDAGGALPGYACKDPNFWMNGSNCVYDYNAVAANEASIKNKALFARGTLRVNDAVSLYSTASYSHASSFGRYAPTPGVLYVAENSPNDPVPGDGLGAFIYHRYAAAGNRDNYIDNTVLDLGVGVDWQVNDRLSVDAGVRRSDARLRDQGRGYIVTPLAEAAAAEGRYNLRDPFGNPDEVIKGFTTTTSREGKFVIDELYANASLDLFDMAGGRSALAFGLESRREDYADTYDSLSEAGVVAGSSGNSAAGNRRVQAAFAEWLLPVADGFDFTLAARYDRYSDYGGDVSPKLSLRWQPLANLTLRGSVGKGFRAPNLNSIHAKRSFSAEHVQDYRSCLAVGYSSAQCGGDANNDGIADGPVSKDVSYQVDTWSSGNPALGSEHSRQYSLGLAWDPLDWLNLTLDYYHIRIDDRIRLIEYQELVEFDNNGLPLPAGTSVERRANGSIREINTAYANEGDLSTRGLDLNLRGRFDGGGWGRLESWLQVARVLEFKVTDGATVKDRLGWAAAPEMRGSLRNIWSRGDWSVNWNVNYIGDQRNPGVKPTFGFLAGDPGTRVGSYVTHDLALTYKAPWNAGITLGANNLGNRYPQLVETDGRPWNFNLYNAYGRIVYLRYTQKF